MKLDLKQLLEILTDEKSALQVAKLAHISVPTVHRKLKALRKAGAVLAETRVPRKKRGPIPTKYRVVRKMVLQP
jgi:predicted ArsR family transcriptional regulator